MSIVVFYVLAAICLGGGLGGDAIPTGASDLATPSNQAAGPDTGLGVQPC